eukprot:CAMPEP_0197639008 /NCGR_PEP_ID=MMETSP1338-20131121/13762_1 /TAXON_ID=43686 ORGANISM="Pelagodinium beii, Strain RCC1491" /NCGR_SAMPLE_ID=MMETSP1338 /ASSEMBLY_ACC=CAM_ASM_000754 /LENGTH=743 /DNA_ID=CAMNT_0043211679 /DNA_START=161 /DNA_END=2392 /DNA_ORIENTATION=-
MTNQGASKSEKRQRRHRRGAGKREQSPAEIREEQEPPRTPGAMSGPSKAAMILGTCSPESVTLCRPQPRRAFFCDEVPAALVDDLQAPRLADESSPLSPWSASYGADEELREVFRGSMAKPCDGRRNSVEGRPLSSVSTSAGPTPSLDGRQSPLSQWTPIPPSVAATPTPVQEEKTNSPAQVRKIFVGAIPQDMTQEDLFEYFKNEVAPVKKAWLQRHRTQPGNQTPAPHNHRGFGFVIFHDSAVVDELMGKESSRFLALKDGRMLDVKRALCSNDIAEKPSKQEQQQSQPLQQENVNIQSQKQKLQELKPQLQQKQHQQQHQQQQQQSLMLQQQQHLMEQQQQMMHRQQQLQQPQPQRPQQQMWTPTPPSAAPTPPPVQEDGPRTKIASPAQVRKIYVGGIPQDMTQEDLFEFFKNEVAPVKKAWLQHHHTQPGNQTPAPHNHRGFGFVIFHDSAVVDELMGNESSRFLQLKDGRTLDVKRALCSNDIAEKPSNQVDKQQSQPLQQDNKSQSQKQEQQEQKPQLQQQQHHQQQQQQSLTLQQQQQLMQQQQQMMQRQQQLQQPQPQQPQQQQLPMQLQQQQLDQQQPTMVPCMVGCGSMTNGCWAQPNTMWASAQRQVTASPTPVLVAAPMQWTSGTAMQQPSQCPSPAPSPSPQPVMYGLQMPGPSGVVAWAGRCESPAVPSMSSPCDGMDPASQNGRMSPPLSVMPHRPQPQVPYEYESWAAREALERCLKEAMPTVYDD